VAYRFHGRARVDTNAPQAFAVCDRCGIWYNHARLHWQFQYAGPNLQNLRILVCDRCLDVPQPQLKPRILPPDPMPVLNARPEAFSIDESNWLVTESGFFLITEDGNRLVTEGPGASDP